MPGLLYQQPQGLLSEPEQDVGLLGALYQNPLLARQVAAQRANRQVPESVTDPRWFEHKKRQEQADQFLLGADVLGAAAPFAKPLGLLAGRMAGPAVESYMARTGLLSPMTAWHGSPHKFDAFDMSKVGTGEGAQAYGHGLYFAESPGVARSYQQNLSDNVFSVGGKELAGPNTKYAQTSSSQARQSLSMPEKMATYALDTAIKAKSPDPAGDAIKHLTKHGKGNADAEAAVELVRQWASEGSRTTAGHLYKVDIPDEAVGKMLDWDKPLSQQTQSVKDAIAPFVPARNKSGQPWPEAWEMSAGELVQRHGPELSESLRKAGVPGIKYLDGGSRGVGKGTYNFVVFDDKTPKIIGRE